MGTSQISVARVRVRYAETDQMNVVYYANYFVWFEVGRTELLRALGWSYREMEADGYSLPVIEASCQYMRSAHYDDELQITTTGTLMSPVRLVFEYTIDRGSDRIVTGRTAHASLNPQGRPVRLPERVKRFFV